VVREGAVSGSSPLLLVVADEVERLLAGAEEELIAIVAEAYRAHGAGRSAVPHSTFLRFPGDDTNRVIALPAYLGSPFEVAGIKWIASFPANVEHGLARASAVLILNSLRTGLAEAVLEGSIISARRTAASAALAAQRLVPEPPRVAGLVGAGSINAEIARFLRVALPSIERFAIHDLDRHRARRLADALEADAGCAAEVAAGLPELAGRCRLVSFATTAIRPHVAELSIFAPGSTILHVSLRDLSAAAILAADNVVDDPDHVCRAETSVHLASRQTGGRGFIRCTLADVLDGRAPARPDRAGVTVFSPFGLGVLDLAVGQFVVRAARGVGAGRTIEGFFPAFTG
jgi:ornithine cyclodeaminase